MKVKILFIAFVISLFSFQDPSSIVHAQVHDKVLEKKLRDYLIAKHINGSVMVSKDTKVIFNEGIGFANRKNTNANLPSTTFPIGSITKAMVAVSVIQLQERGELSVYDSLSNYIPKFPNGRNIKLIHLLNHTSGIQTPNLLGGYAAPMEIVEEASKMPSKFPAGEKWDYNDINYLILGYIVEKVAKEPLHQYIQKNILDKAFMQQSGFITKSNPAPYSTMGYVRIGNQLFPAKKLNLAMLFGCGDIYTTTKDLSLFDVALMNGKLVSKDGLKQILTPSAKSKYGMGLYVTRDKVYSRGVLNGWEALHVYYNDHTSIVILLNVRDKRINIHQVSKDIYDMVRV